MIPSARGWRRHLPLVPIIAWVMGGGLWLVAGVIERVRPGWGAIPFAVAMVTAVGGAVVGWRNRTGPRGAWALLGGLYCATILALAMAAFGAAATGRMAGFLAAAEWANAQLVGMGDHVAALDVAVVSLFGGSALACLGGLVTLMRLGRSDLPAVAQERRETAVDALPLLALAATMSTGLYVVLRVTEGTSTGRATLGVVAVLTTVIAWLAPAAVTALLWWVWVGGRQQDHREPGDRADRGGDTATGGG